MENSLSIIIVTFNSSKSIIDCLKSISINCSVPYEIIIVDNNSQDETLKLIERSNIKVRLLINQENLGFSKANNLGVKESKNNLILFLNPDTVILNDLNPLIDYLMANPKVGIVAPQLIQGDIPQLSVRKLPSILGAFMEFILGIKNSYNPYSPSSETPVAVESVVGAAILIKKDIFLRVGGFDEKYFLYFEDLDLCRKILNLGLKIVYFPQVKFQHTVGVSANTNPKSREYMLKSEKLYYGIFTQKIIAIIGRIGNKFGRKTPR